GYNTLLDGPTFDRLDIDPVAVVLERNHDEAVGVARLESQATDRGLADSQTGVGRFDAVIDGIADQMQQRIADLFDHRTIKLGVLTLDDEVDLLPLLAGDITHDARQPTEDRLDGQHA